MLQELWTLIKLLFSSKPSETNEVTLMSMSHFPFKGFSYMMWCGKMVYRKDTYETRRKEWVSKAYKVKKNHETIHLMQAKMCGSWTKYYLKYLWEWLKGNPLIAPSKSAYYTIPFEVEAYANEEDFNYCKDYDGRYLPSYTFKNRKKLFKRDGQGLAWVWKQYLKTMMK